MTQSNPHLMLNSSRSQRGYRSFAVTYTRCRPRAGLGLQEICGRQRNRCGRGRCWGLPAAGHAHNILLVIPIVGAILSCVALAQVHNSNGTQTGKDWRSWLVALRRHHGGADLHPRCRRNPPREDQRTIAIYAINSAPDCQKKYDEAYDLLMLISRNG